MNTVEIISYQKKYRQAFASLNYEWLEKFFEVEDYDKQVLENPEEKIINAGGAIFFAVEDGVAVGTVAMILRGEGVFELSKMGVTESFQGKQLGSMLIERCLSFAREVGASRVFLDSNRKLLPALSLYRKMGFIEIDVDPNTPYARCNIRMELREL